MVRVITSHKYTECQYYGMISPIEYYKQNENVNDEEYTPMFDADVLKQIWCGEESVNKI